VRDDWDMCDGYLFGLCERKACGLARLVSKVLCANRVRTLGPADGADGMGARWEGWRGCGMEADAGGM